MQAVIKQYPHLKQLTLKRDGLRYVVYDGINVIYRSSPTRRGYVAMLMHFDAKHKNWNVCNRFGRYDLIGKGESKFALTKATGIAFLKP